jgi:hypothetical protein
VYAAASLCRPLQPRRRVTFDVKQTCKPTRRVQGGSGAAAYVSHAAISRASLDSRQCSILCSYANAALGLTECDWPPTLLSEFLRGRIRC